MWAVFQKEVVCVAREDIGPEVGWGREEELN